MASIQRQQNAGYQVMHLSTEEAQLIIKVAEERHYSVKGLSAEINRVADNRVAQGGTKPLNSGVFARQLHLGYPISLISAVAVYELCDQDLRLKFLAAANDYVDRTKIDLQKRDNVQSLPSQNPYITLLSQYVGRVETLLRNPKQKPLQILSDLEAVIEKYEGKKK